MKKKSCCSLCVCTDMCATSSVNRTLIALALQLGDFQSEKNSGINQQGIRVLKCVITLCILIEEILHRKIGLTERLRVKRTTLRSCSPKDRKTAQIELSRSHCTPWTVYTIFFTFLFSMKAIKKKLKILQMSVMSLFREVTFGVGCPNVEALTMGPSTITSLRNIFSFLHLINSYVGEEAKMQEPGRKTQGNKFKRHVLFERQYYHATQREDLCLKSCRR